MHFLCATYFADGSLSIPFGAYMCVENVVMLGLGMILFCECKLFEEEATVGGWSQERAPGPAAPENVADICKGGEGDPPPPPAKYDLMNNRV